MSVHPWKLIIVIVIGAFIPATVHAQTGPFAAVRGYPAGIIPAAGVHTGWPGSGQLETGIWAGYNLTRRRDWGEHDDERGGGFGGGAEAAWFRAGRDGGWFAGLRASVWNLRIDWRDDPATPLGPARAGRTDIVVLQPTLRGGYRFELGGGATRVLRIDVEAALGAEMNVRVDGEDVGQGAILLVGLKAGL